jgi:hypothetical protein
MVDEQIIEYFQIFQHETGKYGDFEIDKLIMQNISLSDENKFKFINGKAIYGKQYIKDYPGKVPLLSSSLNNEGIASNVIPADESHIESNCVTFNKDNAKGSRAFFRDFECLMDRHNYAIVPGNGIYGRYLALVLDVLLVAKKYGWGDNVANSDIIKRLQPSFPKDLNETYTSYRIQEILVEFIEFYTKKNKIGLNLLHNSIIPKIGKIEKLILPFFFNKNEVMCGRFDSWAKMNGIDVKLIEVQFELKETSYFGEFKGGKSTYTKKYINENKGKYPVYSAATDKKTMGVCGYIDSYQYDREAIHITKNGEKTGTVFYLEQHKHSLTGDRAIFLIDLDNFHSKYICYCLKALDLEQKYDWGDKLTKTNFSMLNLAYPKPNKQYTSLELQKIFTDFIEDYFNKIDKMKESSGNVEKKYNEFNQTLIAKTFKL